MQVQAHLRQHVVEVGDQKIYTHDVIADEVVFLRFKAKAEGAPAEDEPQDELEACETAAAA